MRLFGITEVRSQIHKRIVPSGKTHKRVIDDHEVVTVDILFNGRFAELPQAAPIPLNAQLRMLLLIFWSAGN